MPRRKYSEGFYAYAKLHNLETETADAITTAKRRYYAECKRRSKQEMRKRCSAFEILLNDQEFRIIKRKASSMEISVTRFIKMAALSADQVISPMVVGDVREQLILSYHNLQHVLEVHSVATEVKNKILTTAEETERIVLKLLSR